MKRNANGPKASKFRYNPDNPDRVLECLPEMIQKRAYQLFEARGRHPGHELDDWLKAEAEIKHHLGL